VAVVNHTSDTRYHAELLTSHDGKAIPCLRTDRLADIWPGLDASVVLIDEAQFFDDLVPAVSDMVLAGKKVYVAGLDGDFERKKFGAVLDLIPRCDRVTKLASLCSRCRDGTPAIFSKRLTEEKCQVVVGVGNYAPVCRSCY
jgi:thymidine kinase